MPESAPLDQSPVTELKGVGAALAQRLARLDIVTLQDLLFHLPARYQDRSRVTPIGMLREGMEVVVEGKVALCDVVLGRRRSLLCKIADGTGIVGARFFYFNAAQRQQLQRDRSIRCFGEVRRGASGLELYHPEYRVAGEALPEREQTLTPVYPTTEGLGQPRLRQLLEQALQLLSTDRSLRELLPNSIELPYRGGSLSEVLQFLHKPPAASIAPTDLELLTQHLHPAQRQLAFEELVAHQLSLLQLRDSKKLLTAPELADSETLRNRFLEQLPFQLTAAQTRVAAEISDDLAKAHPMLRLVQGDVGSGKTVVAALAALQAIGAGFQVAIMAPTEILAEQHLHSFREWLSPLDIEICWLTGRLKKAQAEQAIEQIGNGKARIAIGTHALFQERVSFADLGLVIIDEQHRFGVHQRLALREKGEKARRQPHQLIMTATPIPRTLTMSAYADLDCSVIDELPPGRSPIKTVVVGNHRRDEVVDRVQRICAKKSQAYWVCTLIEESEALQCEAAEITAANLSERLPNLNIGLVHGRLKGDQKAMVMQAFKAGDIDMLVATTVIEVGVDVPNATLMIVENPERLGLAQLHQLRGRIGRGAQQGYCVLMYQPELSQLAKRRLAILRDHQDGFVIAEKDLEIRGPGEVLGTRQAGLMRFKIADLDRDKGLLVRARQCALACLGSDPAASAALIARWLGKNSEYGQV